MRDPAKRPQVAERYRIRISFGITSRYSESRVLILASVDVGFSPILEDRFRAPGNRTPLTFHRIIRPINTNRKRTHFIRTVFGIRKGKVDMAYIRKIKSGRWLVEVRKKGFPNVNKTFLDLKIARKFGRDVESKMERNVFEDYSGASGTTLKEILIKYRDEKTILKKGAREETSTINALINHQISLNSLMRLKSHHIYKLMRELSKTRKPSTVNKYVNIICHAWRVAKREWGINLPAENPCDMVTLNRFNDTRDRVLSREEYQKLLDACRQSPLTMLTDIVKFAYQTGARQGEILKLKRSDIDFEKKLCTFYDTKNSADRTVPLADETLKILKQYRFGSYVFNVIARRLRKWFERAAHEAKIENFRFHDLRASFCTNALLSGMQIEQVAFFSGHKDWSQLKRYTRIKPEDLLEKINNVVNFK